MTPLLLPGNMCDARLWHGAGGAIPDVLRVRTKKDPVDADLTRNDSIAAMAARSLTTADDILLPVGFSMGAIVALEVARQAPERVAGMVLVGVNASADLPERAAIRPAQQAEVRAGGLQRVLVEELKPNYLAAANRSDLALLDLLCDMGMSLGPDVFVKQSEALRRRGNMIPLLPKLTIPVLLICGLEDALCPPEWHARWAELLPQARLHVVDNAGHMLPLEAPRALAGLIESWLTEVL